VVLLKNNLSIQAILLFLIIILAQSVIALSPDEVMVFVSNNGYTILGEQVGIQEPIVMIKNSGVDYWVVAIMKDNTVNLYIPVNNSNSKVEEGDVSLRKLLETNIIITKITQLKNSSYGLNWPLSYSTRSTFDGLSKDFSEMAPLLTVVSTKMKEISTSDSLKLELLSNDIKGSIEELSSLGKKIAEDNDTARIFEEKYLLNPDTNQTSKYKKYFEDYFESVESYYTKYSDLESNINSLKQGIASLPTDLVSQTDKDGLINYLKLPTTTGKLPSFFSQTNQLKTAIDTVFNSSLNLEGMVLNLKTRITRNNTWKIIYGANSKITKINSSFNSLYDAAETILKEDNVNYWIDQENVELLKINWNQTKTRFDSQDYSRALDAANKSEKNIIPILEKGFPQAEESNDDLIIQIIALLVIILIIIFAYENFYLKKKKLKEEDFDDP